LQEKQGGKKIGIVRNELRHHCERKLDKNFICVRERGYERGLRTWLEGKLRGGEFAVVSSNYSNVLKPRRKGRKKNNLTNRFRHLAVKFRDQREK